MDDGGGSRWKIVNNKDKASHSSTTLIANVCIIYLEKYNDKKVFSVPK